MILRLLIGLVAALAVGVGGFFGWAARHGSIAPLAAPPAPKSFDAALVERGKSLAALGYCVVCHTRSDGPALAGGRGLPTPFGTVYATNITPDPETGIGLWSEAAFRRAMHEGIGRDGRHLYPVFPYDHFTKVTDEDVRAIYAYLMTQKPARYTPPANELGFPFGVRQLLAGWNLLFFESGRFVPDPKRDEAWNRGAYLAEGLGHCGSCHTPRNAMGGLIKDRKFAGATIEGWHGTALDASSPAPIPWTADALLNYLLDGREAQHGIAAGPMTPVVDLLADQEESDIAALAAYILSFQTGRPDNSADAKAFAESRQLVNTPGAAVPDMDPALRPGYAIFMQSCANCHRKGERFTPLALTSTVNGPDPRNVVQIVQHGLRPPRASRGFTMPAFGWMSDKEMADLVRFLRAQFSRNAPWADVDGAIREVRSQRH
jgi:mono/diheme cytochrome c family protein